MEYTAIIPAAGSGTRLNLGYNKLLYITSSGETILQKTLKNFLSDSDCKKIIICASLNDMELFTNRIKADKVEFVLGSECRSKSVFNGLLRADTEYILIHDGARPFISIELINQIKKALLNYEVVVPCIDSIDATMYNNEYIEGVKLVQTPQGFKTKMLLQAMENVDLIKFKDEASILRKTKNIMPYFVQGERMNQKITTQSDLKLL